MINEYIKDSYIYIAYKQVRQLEFVVLSVDALEGSVTDSSLILPLYLVQSNDTVYNVFL